MFKAKSRMKKPKPAYLWCKTIWMVSASKDQNAKATSPGPMNEAKYKPTCNRV